MTSQTKHFIELADIVGLRLECRKCRCSLMISIEGEDSTIHELLSPNNYLLAKCPTCGRAWAQFDNAAAGMGGASFDSEIKKLFRMLQAIQEVESKLGCSLMLEIKPESKTEL